MEITYTKCGDVYLPDLIIEDNEKAIGKYGRMRKRYLKLSSAVGFKGICRKVLIFALVGIGHLLDTHIFGEAGVLRTAIIFFYISYEGLSLVENAAYLGLPIPGKLHKVLEQLHDRSEKEKDKKDGEE